MFPNVTSSSELDSIVSPAVPQEVMQGAGSGAAKGRKHIQALLSDGQQEGNPLCYYWNYESVYFSSQKRIGGKRIGGGGNTTDVL